MARPRSRAHADRDAERRKRSLFLERASRLLDLTPAGVEQRFRPGDLHSGRVNRLRVGDAGAVWEELGAAGVAVSSLGWYPDGATFTDGKEVAAATPAVEEGRFFIQNASSFLPPLALQPVAGEAILDACAAPGGKASHIAALTGGRASLWLNDGIASRIPRLVDVQRTLGFEPATVTTHPAQYLDKFVPGPFDRILLDAQCSGEGLLDLRYPTAFRYWSPARIRKYRHLQTKMLGACFRLLRPGGTLVYSTCTVAPEENEAPVSTLLAREPDAVIEPLAFSEPTALAGVTRWEGERFDPRVAGALRLRPEGCFEAFFLCRIRRLGGGLSPGDLVEVSLDHEGRRRSTVPTAANP